MLNVHTYVMNDMFSHDIRNHIHEHVNGRDLESVREVFQVMQSEITTLHQHM